MFGMVHQRQRLTLGLEAGDDALGVHAQLDDLERDAAADRLLLLGHIDHAAAAFADLLEQLVAADAVAGLFGGRDGQGDGWPGNRRGGRQKIGLAFMGLEQRADAPAQFGVVAAGLIQIRLPLLRRQLQGGFKHRHFALMWILHARTILSLPHTATFEKKKYQPNCGGLITSLV